MANPTIDQIKANIQAQDAAVWDQADARPDGLDLFECDLARAIAAAWADVESGLAIVSLPVMGGSSSPGGPLAAGNATLSPGMLICSASFNLIADNYSCSFPDGATEWVVALVSAISQGIGQNFASLWVPGYSATLVATGGSCAWVPGPTPPPATGPWIGGSIQPFPLASGSSIGDVEMTANALGTAIGNEADPKKLKQNNNTLQPALAALIKAVAAGFETTWVQWKANTRISGGNGTGTAAPPLGAITNGAVTSPQIS